jgi:hypothetical protein
LQPEHPVVGPERQRRDRVVTRFGDEQHPVRHPVEDHAGARHPCALRIGEGRDRDRTDRAGRRQAVDVELGVRLRHGAVCGQHHEHRALAAVRRHADERIGDRAAAQSALDDLLRTIGQVAGEDPAGKLARRAGKRHSAWIDDRVEAASGGARRSAGKPQSPERIVDRDAERVAHRGLSRRDRLRRGDGVEKCRRLRGEELKPSLQHARLAAGFREVGRHHDGRSVRVDREDRSRRGALERERRAEVGMARDQHSAGLENAARLGEGEEFRFVADRPAGMKRADRRDCAGTGDADRDDTRRQGGSGHRLRGGRDRDTEQEQQRDCEPLPILRA